uniref:Myosin tail domain-containing protein n=1 Tax=Neogobius melanostomus TaxID=47308 RepID=A0A8C6UY18_9GOBI
MEFDESKQNSGPEDEPITPTPASVQNPKYQLFLNNDVKINGTSSREQDLSFRSENGAKPQWENSRLGQNNYRGSLESLTSRDWDATSDRGHMADRVFHSPYSTTSMEYSPMYNRMSEYKVQSSLSPATSDLNLYNYNTRSTSPVPPVSLGTGRTRFSTFETLRRKPEHPTTVVPTTHYSVRSATLGNPHKKDYIEELTKELDGCQKRNQFLEAESVEMEKERNQIRFEMRGLLVNNEDLLRTNTQLTHEIKRMREQMLEMDKESQTVAERCREMEIEVKQAREIMVEANNQEYAFNFLQQSLKNQIQDAEENLDKQTQHAQTLAEKLWHAERQAEEFELARDTKEKKTSELSNTVIRLESELNEALQVAAQASSERNLQVKLREDTQIRVDELEEGLLAKQQEIDKLQILVTRLQGEVSGKLVDKERSLEEEIQLRERLQLQCKQAERSLDDLRMELYTSNQSRDELSKQFKVAQERIIDLETDLEDLHGCEQRWASKQKRAIEQMEQLQIKVIQQKDLNEILQMDKDSLERQLRDLRLEVEELQSSRVQEDLISKTESRMKELEINLRTEERNKAILTNTVGKLERKISELTDQLEEEHRISNEQKELITQRMRTLKKQLNEAEEEASRKEAQCRFAQRELAEEREGRERLQRQLVDQQLQAKRMETLSFRKTLDNIRVDLSVDDEDENEEEKTENQTVTKV